MCLLRSIYDNKKALLNLAIADDEAVGKPIDAWEPASPQGQRARRKTRRPVHQFRREPEQSPGPQAEAAGAPALRRRGPDADSVRLMPSSALAIAYIRAAVAPSGLHRAKRRNSSTDKSSLIVSPRFPIASSHTGRTQSESHQSASHMLPSKGSLPLGGIP